jgi:hypothetical protein
MLVSVSYQDKAPVAGAGGIGGGFIDRYFAVAAHILYCKGNCQWTI